MPNLSRRSLLAAASSVGILAAAGCSSNDNKSGNAASSASGGGSAGGEAVFPATITHKFGTTTVEKMPTRVAVVGYTDQDFVLAFGVVPVLVRNWYGPDQVWQPWAKKLNSNLTIQGTDLGSQSIDVEKVAAATPDLIVGVYSGMTKDDYDKLSKIAPVIAQESQFIDYGEPWQNVTTQIGTALGQPAKAKQLIADLEKKFADAKAANPQFDAKTLAVATFNGTDTLSSFSSQDARSRFFQSLGFKAPAAVDTLAGSKFYTTIPLEKASILDGDVLVWDQLSYTKGGQAAVGKNPSLANLAVMKQNHAVYLNPVEVQHAFGWQTILSLPYALDAILPMLQKVLPKK